MGVFTKDNRFEVDNQTHYSTEDLIAILDFVAQKEKEDTEANERHGLYRKPPPEGALIQFIEYNGADLYDGSHHFDHKKNEWLRCNKRKYLVPTDTKRWHVVRVVSPARIYKDPLEALSADTTKVPKAMAQQIAMRLCEMVTTTILHQSDPVTGEHFPAGLDDVEVRILDKKQAKRRAPNLRPAKLYELRQTERQQFYNFSHAVSGIRNSIFAFDRLSTSRQALQLSRLNDQVDQLRPLIEQLEQIQNSLESTFSATPTA